MLLHMLRYKLGDIDFFQAIKNYLADPNLAFGYAKTDNLQQHLETQSGQNLTEFFNDWFLGEGYPSFDVKWNYDTTLNQVNFKVDQTQSDASVSFFETPLPIKVNGSLGESEMLRLELTQNGQQFSEAVTFEVTSIEIDPDFELISKNNTSVLSSKEVLVDPQFALYPNPTKDIIFIKSSNNYVINKITVFNLLGQTIKTISEPLNKISLKGINKGMYSIKIETTQGYTYKNILKN